MSSWGGKRTFGNELWSQHTQLPNDHVKGQVSLPDMKLAGQKAKEPRRRRQAAAATRAKYAPKPTLSKAPWET